MKQQMFATSCPSRATLAYYGTKLLGAQVIENRIMGSTFSHFLLAACLMVLLVGWQWGARADCLNGARELTAYWMPYEGQEDISTTGDLIYLDGPQTQALVDVTGATIALVAEPTFQRCKEEGACYLNAPAEGLRPFWVVRYVGGYNVFERVDILVFPYGLGGWNNNLQPFVSVATSAYPPGTKLYIKELDGLELHIRSTGDHIHNGCVRVDDVAPNAAPCSIRIFAFVYYYFKMMRTSLSGPVHVEERSTCIILDFYAPS